MKVKDVMSADPVCATLDTSLQDIARLMCEHDCGEIPIVQDQQSQRVVGVVTDRDITCRTVALGKNPLELEARDCMTTPVTTVEATTSLDEVCRLMESQRIRRVPVVTDRGECIGIISQADLARSVSSSTVGEVVAEISRPMAGASA